MDQVSRPMQIALVAIVLFAGMWFAVLRPKSDSGAPAPAATPAAPAPGTAGLARAVDKAKGASAASDAANAAVQSATGDAATPNADAAAAAKPAAVKAAAKAAASKAGAAAKASAATTDPSERLLAKLGKGKTVVMLFYGKGADDRAVRRAVRRAAHADHRIVAAFAPITKVGDYDTITTGVDVLTAPTVLVIGKDRRAVALTGFVDQRNVRQAVGDVRRAAAAAKK